MTDAPPESTTAEPAGGTARSRLGGIARWLGAVLILAAMLAFLAGVPGSAAMVIGGLLLLGGGIAFAKDEGRAASNAEPARRPSAGLSALAFFGAVAAFLIGAGRTMGSAPSSSNDFLVEKVALLVALALLVLAVVSFAEPRFRRTAALAALFGFAALFLFNLLIG